MFANKEISRKVCGTTRSESAPHLLVWVYCERCVNIWCLGADQKARGLWERDCISFSSSLMRVKDLQTVAERKEKTKPKFQLGRFLWKARVKKKKF